MNDTIIIGGALAQKPHQAGHTWQFLQYLLGLRKLGWDVLFVDRLEPGMPVDEAGVATEIESSVNLRYLSDTMRAFGLEDSWALLYDGGSRSFGMQRPQILERARRAAFLLNVMGYIEDEEILAAVPRRVFLDTDPGFGQMWQALGYHDLFKGHDAFVTIAENMGRDDCAIPTCGLDWITWRQPIVLDEWEPASGPGGAFTSIGSWRGPYGPIEFRGRTYGLRVHEFRKFVELPLHRPETFEVALDIHAAEERDIELLVSNGWRLADPRTVACDPWTYRRYIQGSRGEFMATKNIYVDTRSGWFSERSICYLASGRPVVAQDTGLADLYPLGEGVIAFGSLAEAIEAVREIAADYPRHARAARRLAQECFDSDRVFTTLFQRLGI